MKWVVFLATVAIALLPSRSPARAAEAAAERHLLYVAVPGIRDDPHYGGAGLLVFDIDHGHRFVRRIPVPVIGDAAKPQAVKGICASAKTGRLYLTTPRTLACLDPATGAVVWQASFPTGCDRLSITPDGRTLFVPSFEGQYWHVVDAATGRERSHITTGSGSHNTVCGPGGKLVYLAGLRSPLLAVADVATGKVDREVGPFSAPIRPFTVNGSGTRCYVCVNGLLGFEVGDPTSGKKLWRVEVKGFATGPTKRHGCPSHGIGLTPDEKQVWVSDAHNSRMDVFDNTVAPPRQIDSIPLRDQPGWITFGIGGRFAYPSTGDVIDVATRKVVGELTDEQGRAVQSEKLLELDFAGDTLTRAGDQFGVGQKKD